MKYFMCVQKKPHMTLHCIPAVCCNFADLLKNKCAKIDMRKVLTFSFFSECLVEMLQAPCQFAACWPRWTASCPWTPCRRPWGSRQCDLWGFLFATFWLSAAAGARLPRLARLTTSVVCSPCTSWPWEESPRQGSWPFAAAAVTLTGSCLSQRV